VDQSQGQVALQNTAEDIGMLRVVIGYPSGCACLLKGRNIVTACLIRCRDIVMSGPAMIQPQSESRQYKG
jgi:hypothetical protein